MRLGARGDAARALGRAPRLVAWDRPRRAWVFRLVTMATTVTSAPSGTALPDLRSAPCSTTPELVQRDDLDPARWRPTAGPRAHPWSVRGFAGRMPPWPVRRR